MNYIQYRDLAAEKGSCTAYGEAMGRPSWGDMMEQMVPAHMWSPIARWILFGEVYGGFLNAFVRGDLFKALEKADDVNRQSLHDTAMFFWNGAPSGCFGSAEKADQWKANGGYLGVQK